MLPSSGGRSPPGSPSASAAAKNLGGLVLPAPRCMKRFVTLAVLVACAHALYDEWFATPPPAAPRLPCPVARDSAAAPSWQGAAGATALAAASAAADTIAAAAPHKASLLVEPDLVKWPEPIIPKLIHQTWKGRDKSKPLPGWVQSSVDRCHFVLFSCSFHAVFMLK